ncbi:MAG: hypothetical protein OXI22_10515, partial [Defluviicoccus sp.]|nr:hypothetical protein [Defluviicoccus sp.]
MNGERGLGMGRTLLANPAHRRDGGRLAVWLAPLLAFALWAAEATAQSTVLVSNLGQPETNNHPLGSADLAQKFTTGPTARGYTLTGVDLRLVISRALAGDFAAPRVVVVRGAATGSDSVEVARLTAGTSPIPRTVAGNYALIAPENTVLSPSTDYWLVVERAMGKGGHVRVLVTRSDAVDTSSAAGWSIDDDRLHRNHASTGSFSGHRDALMIRVNGSRINTAATGTPEIAGTATVGRRLQASRGSVADDDGVSPPFAYQWIRVDAGTETEIPGATFSSYPLAADDLGKQVKVRLSFADDGGAEETRTSEAYPPSGSVRAAPLPGTPGSALVSNLAQTPDAGLRVGDFDLAQKFTTGDNAGGYTLARVDLGLLGLAGVGAGTAAPRVRLVRGAATGSGSVEVASLAAETDPIPPGVPGGYAFIPPPDTALRPATDYWVVVEAASSGGGVRVGATQSDAEDAGSAAGWSIDDGRLDRNHASTAAFDGDDDALMIRISGSRINSPATGTPEIAGTATVGRRLHASRGSVMDPDGVSPPFAYQWVRVDAGTETEISGATASSYPLDAADLGKQVRVRLSFTDDGGGAETRSSEAYPPSGSVRPAPMPGTPGAALVSNLEQNEGAFLSVGEFDLAQKFTTGNTGGYTLARVDIRLNSGSGTGTAAPRVSVVRGAATGSGSVEVATLDAETDPIPPGMSGDYAFLAPPNTALRPATDYWVVVEAAPGGGDVRVAPTESDAEDAGAAAGWSIDDGRLDRNHASTGAFDGHEDALMLRVSGSRSNSPATGTPEIAGTATVGRRLQAGRGSVADRDGVPSSFRYRWIRIDAGTETEIAGATASSYQLGADDEGKRVRVRLSFTDGGGAVETRTSEAYPPSGSVQPAPLPGTPGAALVGNLGQSAAIARAVNFNDFAQKFTTGGNAGGYTLARVDLRLSARTRTGNAAPRVRVVRGAAAGSGSVEVARLAAETGSISRGMPGDYAFIAPPNTALRPSTDYWVVIEAAPGGGDVRVSFTSSESEDATAAASPRIGTGGLQRSHDSTVATAVATVLSDAEDASSAPGWSIDDRGLQRRRESTGAFTAVDDSLMIRVSGLAVGNAAPVAADGSVRIRPDTRYAFRAGDFGFSDADGDALAGIAIRGLDGLPAGSSLRLGGASVTAGEIVTRARLEAGALAFAPAAGASGSPYASFTFTVSDGLQDSAPATMTIHVVEPAGERALGAWLPR